MPIPVPSATVILAREQDSELKVYLMKRNPGCRFMPGMYVFPGGQVSQKDRDTDFWSKRMDLTRGDFEKRFCQETTYGDALSHCVAAIRETAEESGVFLVSHGGNCFRSNPCASMDENGKVCREKEVFRILSGPGQTLPVSAIYPWSRWITPLGMQKRFDTRYFTAVMPEGQHCLPDGHEAVSDIWIHPEAALHENLSGHIPLSPPTLVTLHQMAGFKRLWDFIERATRFGWVSPMIPRRIQLDDGEILIEPWDPFYHSETIPIEAQRLESAVLPVGVSFSRIWGFRGRYRPVGIV